jgi:hypothetical protein
LNRAGLGVRREGPTTRSEAARASVDGEAYAGLTACWIPRNYRRPVARRLHVPHTPRAAGIRSNGPGQSDMVLRNRRTGAFEVYDIAKHHDSAVSRPDSHQLTIGPKAMTTLMSARQVEHHVGRPSCNVLCRRLIPSALAVLRLTASSNLTGCHTQVDCRRAIQQGNCPEPRYHSRNREVAREAHLHQAEYGEAGAGCVAGANSGFSRHSAIKAN